MRCEQTFKVAPEEKADPDFCPECRQNPNPGLDKVVPKERKWTTVAGPIQSKKVREAIGRISWEGRTFVEVTGVIGGEEHRATFTQIFGGNREDCNAALLAVGDKFQWQVTRSNYQDILAEVDRQLVTLQANRPVNDKRETPEQRAETIRKNRERAEKEAAYQVEQTAKREAERAAAVADSYIASVPSGGNASVRYNREHDGVEIAFPDKPERSVILKCKGQGFRWSPRSHVWYRKFSMHTWQAAHSIAGIPVAVEPSRRGIASVESAYVQAQEDAQQDAIAAAIGA
jgi:hypothetical protein